MCSISFTHSLGWGLNPALILIQPSNTSAGNTHRNSLLAMPHSWVSGFLKIRGTHLTLVKKGNKKSRVTRSRKGMLFFFFEQTNIYFNLVKQLVEALLSSSTLHFVFTLSSFCDKNNTISNPEVSRVSVTSNKMNRTPNTKQNPPWYILTGDLCMF